MNPSPKATHAMKRTERNLALIHDYESGLTQRQCSVKYKLTQQRVSKILHGEGAAVRPGGHWPKKKKLPRGNRKARY